MIRKVLLVLIAIALVSPMVLFSQHNNTEAKTTYCYSYDDSTYRFVDGYVWKDGAYVSGNSTYATPYSYSPPVGPYYQASVHGSIQGRDAEYSGSEIVIGQVNSGSGIVASPTNNTIWRGALYFDTSTIPKDAEITSAKVYLFGSDDYSTTDFNLALAGIEQSDLNTPITTYDYDTLRMSTTIFGNINTSSWDTIGYNEIVLNADGMKHILGNAVTTFAVRSEEDINMSEPTGNEYVSFWSGEIQGEIAGVKGPPYMVIDYIIPELGIPSYFEILDARLFTGYQLDTENNPVDDLLFVIEYYVSYGGIYSSDSSKQYASSYFNLRLKDDVGNVVAQVPLPRLGRAVASIYLSPTGRIAVPDPGSGGYYHLDIASVPEYFPTAGSFETEEWNLENIAYSNLRVDMKPWILGLADGMSNYYSSYYVDTDYGLTDIVLGKHVLNDLGVSVFDNGKEDSAIAGLSARIPDMFKIRSVDPIVTNNIHPNQYGGGPTGAFGTNLTAAFDGLGSYFGVPGGFLAAGFWMFVMLIVAGVVVIGSGNSSVAILVALPILFIGNYLGVIPFAITALLVVGASIIVFHNFFLQRT